MSDTQDVEATLGFSSLTTSYAWNVKAGRYIADNGRFVTFDEVKGALFMVEQRSSTRMERIAQALMNGEITLFEWQTRMAREIKLMHTAAVAAANGGWAQVSPADEDRLQERIGFQYERLNLFAEQLYDGRQLLNGAFLQRTRMYALAAGMTFEDERTRTEEERGMTEERNILGIAEHCPGCLTETARGWVPIGELVPIGMRDCLTHCHCTKDFR